MNEEAMRKALKECVEFFGESILADKTRFRSALQDRLPGFGLQKERNLLIISAVNFSLGEKLLKAPPGKEVRERFCRSLLKEIIGNGLSREAAASVLRSFTLALDWQVIIACENAASDKGENEGAKPTPQPVVTGSSCPHAHIDFSACRCRDCDQLLYGIYNDNGCLPYESMRKREHEGVLASVRERCAGLLVLPDHITAIGDDCFSEQEELEEVVLPASLHSIGRYAFDACPALKSIKVPETVTSIGEAAFRGLKRVYYDGPAACAPWGAKEHIVSTNAALRQKTHRRQTLKLLKLILKLCCGRPMLIKRSASALSSVAILRGRTAK